MTLTREVWYAYQNDMIGGWSVMNVNKPPSQADFRIGEFEIADFVREADAKEIAYLHNKSLQWNIL